MNRAARLLMLLLATTPAITGCGGGGSAGGFVAPAASVAPAVSASAPVAPVATASFALLAQEERARAQEYLAFCVNAPPVNEGLYTQAARLALGAPIDRGAIERSLDHVEARKDTADFHANGLLRIRIAYGAALATDLRARIDRVLRELRYALEDPHRGEELCFWSENHQVLFATGEYLAGSQMRTETFPVTGRTGAWHEARGKARIERWLDHRMRFGFSEWYSPVYYTYDFMPLLNLVDFAPDADVREKAALVLDLLVFDLARLTHKGSLGVSAGRAYEEHKWSGWGQSVGDAIEVLFGTRGRFSGRNAPAAIWLALSSYRAPYVLLAIGRDRPARSIDRSRNGISIAEGASHGIGFQTTEDALFWWGMGAYTAKETVVLSRATIDRYGIVYDAFEQVFGPLKGVPDALLPTVADVLSPLSEGSILSTANVLTLRTEDAMLSSVQSYRRGQVGFQQHAWQATLDNDAVVFTTAPGNLGRDGPGPWTGSGSMPRVVQVEDVALILYDPKLPSRTLFPAMTHAFFPRAAFDEVVQDGYWTFGRKGRGYVALWSAYPVQWQKTGTFTDRELVAPVARNAWVCQVGNEREDGTFADFRARGAAARVSCVGEGNDLPGTPLSVTYDAPGVGLLELAFEGAPSRNGQTFHEGGFPRYDGPYSQTPWGARRVEIAHAGAKLVLDLDRGTRAGDGVR